MNDFDTVPQRDVLHCTPEVVLRMSGLEVLLDLKEYPCSICTAGRCCASQVALTISSCTQPSHHAPSAKAGATLFNRSVQVVRQSCCVPQGPTAIVTQMSWVIPWFKPQRKPKPW